MKMWTAGRWSLLVPMTCLLIGFAGCGKKAPERLTKLETDLQKYSYAMGMAVGNSVKKLPGELDIVAFQQGLEDMRSSDKQLLSEEEAMNIQMTEGQKRAEAQAKLNEEQCKSFLADNGKKPGVVTTASGLQYEVLQPAEGPKPSAQSLVTVHYTGTLLDSTKFDSSIESGQPVEFKLGGMIPGWDEALQLMSTGSKYRFWIPPALGYGARGMQGVIPPNSVLVFEVELISFK